MKDRNRKTAIQISGVKKQYRLGQIGGGTLQGDLQSWWARIRGKEDPNSKIGSSQRIQGQIFMALNGIDLTVYQGEALGIIGSNGAGKSTLLKILSRVTAPSEGEIDIYGRIASMLEVGTGFSGEMTGRENIYMNGAILGMTKAEIDAKMEDIIDFSEVREFIDTPVKRYSSGMYVKLAFSVAAHLDSEILIMDEVLAVGDMAFQKKCLTKMKDAATKEGRTVLYVSHNMNTIRQLCNRCILLDQGKIIFNGDPEEAISRYLGTTGRYAAEYTYTDKYHSNFKSRGSFRMKSLKLISAEEPRFRYGEKAELFLVCRATRKWTGVGFRFEIQYQDGSIAGTMPAGSYLDFEPEKDTPVRLDLDFSHIAPGKYKADIVAYQLNEYGSEQYLDGVYPGFVFEIDQEISAENSHMWLHKYWGHVRLEDVKASLAENIVQ